MEKNNMFLKNFFRNDPESLKINDPSEKEKEFLNLIDDNFSPDDSLAVKTALLLAREVHEGQVQPDGNKYIEHPIEVASIIIEKFKLKRAELVATALLHDVLEDQADSLFINYIERNNFFPNSVFSALNLKMFTTKFSDELREVACMEIKENFNESIAERVRRLSKPSFDNLIDEMSVGSDEERVVVKNKMYSDYFAGLLNHEDQGLGVVKCADLLNNSSRNYILTDQKKREKLAKKYSPVIDKVVVPFLKGLDESHCLYNVSADLANDFLNIYERDLLPLLGE